LLNLCLNARDATDPGHLILVEAGQHQENGRTMAFLTVRDHGRGMAPEVLERAAEPFFTTKQGGAGTGLGLSTVRTVAVTHGGYVHIDSASDRGTTVRMSFPAYCEPTERQPIQNLGQGVAEAIGGQRGGRILIVDDEEGISLWLTSILGSQGYEIKSA